MKLEIELKEIKTKGDEQKVDTYPETGVYHSLDSSNIFIVDKEKGFVNYICTFEMLLSATTKKEESKEELKDVAVPESIFLKALSLVVNKDETYKE